LKIQKIQKSTFPTVRTVKKAKRDAGPKHMWGTENSVSYLDRATRSMMMTDFSNRSMSFCGFGLTLGFCNSTVRSGWVPFLRILTKYLLVDCGTSFPSKFYFTRTLYNVSGIILLFSFSRN
jgi:hypothetical protein